MTSQVSVFIELNFNFDRFFYFTYILCNTSAIDIFKIEVTVISFYLVVSFKIVYLPNTIL